MWLLWTLFLALILVAVELIQIQNKHSDDFDICFYWEQHDLSLRIAFFLIVADHVVLTSTFGKLN